MCAYLCKVIFGWVRCVVRMSVQACLCMHVAVSADVQDGALNCPLDFGVWREAGVLPLSQVRGMWDQPRPTEEGLRPDLLPEMDHPTLGSSLRTIPGRWSRGSLFFFFKGQSLWLIN